MEAYERAVELFSEPSAELPSKIKEYLDDIGYISGLSQIYKAVEEAASRKENVMELLNAAAAFTERGDAPPTLEGFLDAFALLDDHDTSDDDDQKESVTLTTVHAAKGLEFGVVIGVGMEVGLFPHERSVEEGSLEEERRLFYVALTRAKDQLYLTWSRFRKKYGRTLQRLPSQFLDDLPNDQVVHVTGEELFKPASPDEVAETFRLMKERFS
jgi:superfamily I DNA/RNA helicase